MFAAGSKAADLQRYERKGMAKALISDDKLRR
jgi:hypothetical protein